MQDLHQELEYLFFLMSTSAEELISTPNVIQFLPNPLPTANFPDLPNPIPYAQYF